MRSSSRPTGRRFRAPSSDGAPPLHLPLGISQYERKTEPARIGSGRSSPSFLSFLRAGAPFAQEAAGCLTVALWKRGGSNRGVRRETATVS